MFLNLTHKSNKLAALNGKISSEVKLNW